MTTLRHRLEMTDDVSIELLRCCFVARLRDLDRENGRESFEEGKRSRGRRAGRIVRSVVDTRVASVDRSVVRRWRRFLDLNSWDACRVGTVRRRRSESLRSWRGRLRDGNGDGTGSVGSRLTRSHDGRRRSRLAPSSLREVGEGLTRSSRSRRERSSSDVLSIFLCCKFDVSVV